jgi:hypothetical protein
MRGAAATTAVARRSRPGRDRRAHPWRSRRARPSATGGAEHPVGRARRRCRPAAGSRPRASRWPSPSYPDVEAVALHAAADGRHDQRAPPQVGVAASHLEHGPRPRPTRRSGAGGRRRLRPRHRGGHRGSPRGHGRRQRGEGASDGGTGPRRTGRTSARRLRRGPWGRRRWPRHLLGVAGPAVLSGSSTRSRRSPRRPGPPVGHQHTAVAHLDDALGRSRDVVVVGDEQDGLPRPCSRRNSSMIS